MALASPKSTPLYHPKGSSVTLRKSLVSGSLAAVIVVTFFVRPSPKRRRASRVLAAQLPVVSILPFAAMLLAIAVLPLAAGHWWEHNRNKGIIAALLAVPLAIYLVASYGADGMHALQHAGQEYISFIVLSGIAVRDQRWNSSEGLALGHAACEHRHFGFRSLDRQRHRDDGRLDVADPALGASQRVARVNKGTWSSSSSSSSPTAAVCSRRWAIRRSSLDFLRACPLSGRFGCGPMAARERSAPSDL